MCHSGAGARYSQLQQEPKISSFPSHSMTSKSASCSFSRSATALWSRAPGTGKTHTIANVISHYLANGKRVLVTSMKDPALAVLRDQLPDDIRPLAISLLSTELDGMKQFEHAIHKIASEVQSIDRTATARQMSNLKRPLMHYTVRWPAWTTRSHVGQRQI